MDGKIIRKIAAAATFAVLIVICAAGCRKGNVEGGIGGMYDSLKERITGAQKQVGASVTDPADKAHFAACSASLRSLKMIFDTFSAMPDETGGLSSPDPNNVCKMMTQREGCGAADIEAGLSQSCLSIDGSPWRWDARNVDFSGQGEYRLMALSRGATPCAFCATPRGVFPDTHDKCSPTPACP